MTGAAPYRERLADGARGIRLVSRPKECYFRRGSRNSFLDGIAGARQGNDVLNGPDFQKTPLIPVIAQDHQSGVVLMLAYMNEEAFRETVATGRVCYYSRSRKGYGAREKRAATSRK